MIYDARLIPWLELADELEKFDHFMHTTGRKYFPGGRSSRGVEFDAGTTTAKRMRAIAANPWTWFSWKRDGMRGEVRRELHTFYRWISESGGDSWYQETEAGREMLARIASIDRKFKQLTNTRRGSAAT